MLNELQYLDQRRAWLPHYQRICWVARENAGSQKIAKLPQNRLLNRYRDVLPYDHSRVVLKEGGETDYINANFVEAPDVNRKYVLSQGPLQHTSHHFWQMVWELNTAAIVMLNKTIEKNQVKCHQYWPSGEIADHVDEITFGNFRIHFLSAKKNQYYTVRSLEIEHLETRESRVVSHYHYTTWPDFGVPSSPSTFLAFLFEIRKAGVFSEDVGPTVIHCSAGIGRSGTLIMVDTVLEMIAQSQDMDSIDITATLLKLRHYRTGLIQTADQLRFTYVAIAEAVSILMPDIYRKAIDHLREQEKEEEEEEEPPPVPPRSGRRKLTEEPSSETPTEPDGAKRPRTRRTSVPKDTGSVELLGVEPEKLRKKRKKNKKKWKGIERLYSCTKRLLAGVESSSEGSDAEPDEIIDLSSSDLSSDDQPVCVMTKVDDTEDNKSGEEIEKKKREEEVEMQGAGAVDGTEGGLEQSENSESVVNTVVETGVSVGTATSAREIELKSEGAKEMTTEGGDEMTAKSAENVKNESVEEINNVVDLKSESAGDQNEESVEQIKNESAAELKSTVEARNDLNAVELKTGSVRGLVTESTEEVSNGGVLGSESGSAEDVTSTSDLKVKETSAASSAGEVECGSEKVLSPGERGSSVTETPDPQQESCASVKREGTTRDLQENDASEEEVVIRRMTVVRSKGAASTVESSSENVRQTNSVYGSPDSDLTSIGQQGKIMNNLHQDHKIVHSQDSQEARTGQLTSEHVDQDYPAVGMQEPGTTCTGKDQRSKDETRHENPPSPQDTTSSERVTELRKRREDRKQKTSELIHNIKAKVKHEEERRKWKGGITNTLLTFTTCIAAAIAAYYGYRYFTGAT